jgi:hypothetical protein
MRYALCFACALLVLTYRFNRNPSLRLPQEQKKLCFTLLYLCMLYLCLLTASTEILLCDYRKTPLNQKFDKIASIEMAEHVGIANFVDPYLKTVRNLMKRPDSSFLLQVFFFYCLPTLWTLTSRPCATS